MLNFCDLFRRFLLHLLFLSFINQVIYAQKQKTESLDTVRIESFSIPKSLKNLSPSTKVISKSNLLNGDGLNYSKIINRAPGIYMQSGTLNTNRITIRGIGARSPFSTVGIKAYLGEIPLTDGNGISVIENIELQSLSNIIIHKGPVNSSYGVSLGGLILLSPEKVKASNASYETSFGSFGLRKNVLKTAFMNRNFSGQVVYSNSFNEGYRVNNQFNRNSFTVLLNSKINPKDNLDFVANYYHLKAFIPSSLSQKDFENEPTKAAFTWGAAKGFEDVKSSLIGLTWNHSFSKEIQQKLSAFSGSRNNFEPRPFNILNETSFNYGIRYRLLKEKATIKWSIGGTFFGEKAKENTFKNLYQDFPVGTGSVKGEALNSYNTYRSFYNLFAESSLKLAPKWRVNLGLNLNQTFFRIKNTLEKNDESFNNNFDFKPIISPKISLNYRANSTQFFASVSQGFTTPTSEETLLPDGVFNPNLKPETGWNYEVGGQVFLLNRHIEISNSLFLLEVSNLIVNRRSPDGQIFAINAGKTNHFGLETSGVIKIINSQNLALNFNTNATLNRFKFAEFIDNGTNFKGNALTGVPSEVINAATYFRWKSIMWKLNFQHVGEIPVNDANAQFSKPFQLFDTQITFSKKVSSNFKLNSRVGVENIFNEKYASQIQVNASSFGNAPPRFFYPGLPRNFYGSISLEYFF